MDCSLTDERLNLNVVNSLGQAAAYREANFKVVIVDMGGVERDGLDVAHIPACEVLGVDCVDGIPKGLGKIQKKGVSNFSKGNRGGTPDISKTLSQQITSILKHMDCSYDYLQVDEGVRILHQSDMFLNCSQYSNKPASNEKQACSLMKHAAGCSSNESIESNIFDEQMNKTIDISSSSTLTSVT